MTGNLFRLPEGRDDIRVITMTLALHYLASGTKLDHRNEAEENLRLLSSIMQRAQPCCHQPQLSNLALLNPIVVKHVAAGIRPCLFE